MDSLEVTVARGAGRDARRASLNGLAVRLGAVALSFLLVGLLVVQSSQAAFTAATQNTGNAATTGRLVLSDDDAGNAMFNVAGLAPGAPVERCIHVTYGGNLDPGPIRLYAAAPPTGDLAPYLRLTVEIGPDNADAFGNCASFTPTATVHPGTRTLADFAANLTSYDNGLDTWNPAGAGETRTFRFRLEVEDNNAAQAKSCTFGFAWEARSS